jgi:hypothetical protein
MSNTNETNESDLFNKGSYYTTHDTKSVDSDMFWLDDPTILYNKTKLNQIFPSANMTLNEKSNAVVRLGVAIGLALFLLKNDTRYLYVPIFAAIFTIMMVKYNKDPTQMYFDSFNNSGKNVHNDKILNTPETVKPTEDNPFMNANQITDSRDKPPATASWDNAAVQDKIEKKFETNLYRDVGDLYGKNNSQREFYTMPSTTFPHAQTEFAKWCYGSGPTCKERTIECVPYTNCLNAQGF